MWLRNSSKAAAQRLALSSSVQRSATVSAASSRSISFSLSQGPKTNATHTSPPTSLLSPSSFSVMQARGFAGGALPYSDHSGERPFGMPRPKEGEASFKGGWELHYAIYILILAWGGYSYAKIHRSTAHNIVLWAREEALHTPEVSMRGPVVKERGIIMKGENANFFPGDLQKKLEVNQSILRAARVHVQEQTAKKSLITKP